MLSKTTKNTSGLLWGSLISAVPEAGNQEIHRGLGNGFRNRSGLYKTDNFYAFVGFPPFRRSQKPEIQKSTGALEMASGKGADSTKSTNFWFLWGSPFFGGPQKPEIQEIHRGLGNGFRKRSGLCKINKFWAFVGFPPFRLS